MGKRMGKYCNIPKEVLEQLDQFVEFDETNVEKELENNIAYESILNHYLYDTTNQLIVYESELDSIRASLRPKYMTGNIDNDDAYNNLRLNRSEIESAIDSNKNVIILKQKIKETNNMISFYERTLQTIRNKNYTMKNYIDYIKFKAGV